MDNINNVELRMSVIQTLQLSFLEIGNPALSLYKEIDDFVEAIVALPDGRSYIPEKDRIKIIGRLEQKLGRRMPSF
jgi:hypothetical protein